MLVLKGGQMNLWEQILPEELRKLPKELEVIDKILEDQCFFEPYLKKFNTKIGRPTVKVETYIRMMFLKTCYQFGYETLVSEVSDSISWRRFCHLAKDEKVPHSTTLIKLNKKYGSIIMDELNQALLVKANNEKIIRGKKLRIDTTVVESNIHHPSDTSEAFPLNRTPLSVTGSLFRRIA
ncbi:MAG: transposase [Bacillota bacterium]